MVSPHLLNFPTKWLSVGVICFFLAGPTLHTVKAQSNDVIGFSRDRYSTVEGEDFYLCIILMGGSFTTDQTANLTISRGGLLAF